MNIDPREVQRLGPQEVLEQYKGLYFSTIPAHLRVAPEDKEVLGGYSQQFFEMADGMNTRLLDHDLVGFDACVASAVPRLKEIEGEMAGGIIQPGEVANELMERIQRTLDVSENYLKFQWTT